MSDCNRYHAFGLQIESRIELPELGLGTDEIDPASVVRLAYGETPSVLAGGRRIGNRLEIAGNAALIRVEGVAVFHVCGGTHVTIQIMAGAHATQVRHFLFGLVFGVLFVQRRIVAMHASGIEINGTGVAFTGPSGSGKSTLAAYMNRRGHRLICDDACVVDVTSAGTQTCHGISHVKLWRESLNAIAPTETAIETIQPTLDKYYLPASVPNVQPSRRVPLRALYRVELAEPDVSPGIVAITGLAALDVIRENVHGRHLHRLVSGEDYFLARCMSIQRSLPVYSLRIPRDFHRLAEVAARLETHKNVDASELATLE